MDDITVYIGIFIVGILLGIIFYGGLWWTVQKGVPSKNPALWFLFSFLLRMAIVLAGFYFVSGGHWERMLSCLLGFILARVIITKLSKSMKEVAHEN